MTVGYSFNYCGFIMNSFSQNNFAISSNIYSSQNFDSLGMLSAISLVKHLCFGSIWPSLNFGEFCKNWCYSDQGYRNCQRPFGELQRAHDYPESRFAQRSDNDFAKTLEDSNIDSQLD